MKTHDHIFKKFGVYRSWADRIWVSSIDGIHIKRGMLSTWCNQEVVLNLPSVGIFLIHSVWNSILESLSAGVLMICWPFFAD